MTGVIEVEISDNSMESNSFSMKRNKFLASNKGNIIEVGTFTVDKSFDTNKITRELFGEVVFCQYSRERNKLTNISFELSGKLFTDINIYSYGTAISLTGVGTLADIQPVLDFLAENSLPYTEPSGSVHMLMTEGNGISFQTLPNNITTTLTRDNYTEEVLSGFDRVVADLSSDTPKGRIGIFDGLPGCGKTWLLRGLLTSVKNTAFVFISPRDITALTEPSVLSALINFSIKQDGKSITFLVEDADECLAPRGADNMSAISAVLNLGDGILGQLLDIRLILTTNAKRHDFDAAITRPGRLSACVKVDKLPAEQCNAIYHRITDTLNIPGITYEGGVLNRFRSMPFFDKPMTLAEVYQKANDANFTPATSENKLGF